MLRPRGSTSVVVFASAPGDGLHLSCARPLVVYPATCPVRIRPPAPGDDWIHEPKWDGFRFQVIKDGAGVRFYSRLGAEYTERLPGMAEAFAKLLTKTAILDGELVLVDPGGAARFYLLMPEMRTGHPDESQLMFLAFDLLHQDGVDLRGLPLSSARRTCTGSAASLVCPSSSKSRPSPMVRCCSTGAASAVLKASSAKGCPLATRADRAAIGPR